MKKLICTLLALTLALTLPACGKKETSAQTGGNPSYWDDDQTSTTAATTQVQLTDGGTLAAQGLENLIKADTAEAAKAFMTEDSWDMAQTLIDIFPDEEPEVTAEIKASNGEYAICYYTVHFPSHTEPFQSGYAIFQRGEDAYKLCENAEVHNKVIAPYLCNTCGGGGSVTTGTPVTCAICGGTGTQYIPNAYYDAGMNMWMGQYMGCSGCGGSGHIGGTTTSICGTCTGVGFVFP